MLLLVRRTRGSVLETLMLLPWSPFPGVCVRSDKLYYCRNKVTDLQESIHGQSLFNAKE